MTLIWQNKRQISMRSESIQNILYCRTSSFMYFEDGDMSYFRFVFGVESVCIAFINDSILVSGDWFRLWC